MNDLDFLEELRILLVKYQASLILDEVRVDGFVYEEQIVVRFESDFADIILGKIVDENSLSL